MDTLAKSERHQLADFINQTFGDGTSTLDCTTIVEYAIRTTSPPIKQRYYPLFSALQKHVDAELEKMLEDDIIEHCDSLRIACSSGEEVRWVVQILC
ncbi:hypothetical protein JTB14_030511 [Gonioctena quinquepunctata]|nr:hypothetical protein JTB14_030511 [Gonioctena quinquepunctata]